MCESGIYTITNTVNGKVYVGQANCFKIRFKTHRVSLKANTHCNPLLQRAYNKYGVESLVFEILEYHDLEYLASMELYWMNLLDATNRDKGYNIKSGSPTRYNGCYTPEFGRKVSMALKGKKRAQAIKDKYKEIQSKPLSQYTLSGEYVRDWRSPIEVQEVLEIGKSCVGKCCRGESQAAGGFIWKYKIDTTSVIPYQKPILGNSISQYSLTGELIATWDNTKRASEGTGINRTLIYNCINGSKRAAGKFLWRRGEEVLRPEDLEIMIHPRPVYQYTFTGEFIKKWDSASEIANVFNCKVSTIRLYANGKTTYSPSGFHWSYKQLNLL